MLVSSRFSHAFLEVLEVFWVYGIKITHRKASAGSSYTKVCLKSDYILAENVTCENAASRNFSTFSVSDVIEIDLFRGALLIKHHFQIEHRI